MMTVLAAGGGVDSIVPMAITAVKPATARQAL